MRRRSDPNLEEELRRCGPRVRPRRIIWPSASDWFEIGVILAIIIIGVVLALTFW